MINYDVLEKTSFENFKQENSDCGKHAVYCVLRMSYIDVELHDVLEDLNQYQSSISPAILVSYLRRYKINCYWGWYWQTDVLPLDFLVNNLDGGKKFIIVTKTHDGILHYITLLNHNKNTKTIDVYDSYLDRYDPYSSIHRTRHDITKDFNGDRIGNISYNHNEIIELWKKGVYNNISLIYISID
jgi:hypothetical protein